MTGLPHGSQKIMSSNNDHLIVEDMNESSRSVQDSGFHEYAGMLYDRVDTACHLHKCEQISHFNCQQLYFYPFGSNVRESHDRYSSPVSRTCEYCGSSRKCRIDCQRPILFSQKKRPPFSNDEGWDEYDFPIAKPPVKRVNDNMLPRTTSTASKASWISGLFETF